MRVHEVAAAQALATLQSSASGLAAREAGRRLAEYGPNRVEPPPRPRLLLRFLSELTHLFAVLLWLAAALAFLAESYQPGQGMAVLGAAVVAVVLVNGAFSFWQEHRAEQAIGALEDLLPREVSVCRDGRDQRVPATEVVPGDMLLLEEGDDAPADCRVIEAHSLRVSNAVITGESTPTVRDAEPSSAGGMLRATNVVLAGTAIVSGRARAVVFATGMATEIGRIARLTGIAGPALSPLQREVVGLSRVVSVIAVCLGVAFFLAGRAIGLAFWETALFAIGIIVANVPEGLLPTVTLALAMGSQRMARKNALIRHLPAVETLGSATVICSDKTGTLTENRMVARHLHVAGVTLPVGGARTAGDALAPLLDELAEEAGSCHNVRLEDRAGKEGYHGDPMEVALVVWAASRGKLASIGERTDEIPFDSQRRRLSTVHARGSDRVLVCKGAPEAVLPLCTSERTLEGAAPLGPGRRHALHEACASMARDGLRVLAYARRTLPRGLAAVAGEVELELTGLVALEDPPRPEVAPAIRRCRGAGIRTIMVTGDHAGTATAIARQIGMIAGPAPTVIEGDALDRMTDTQVQLALDLPDLVFARTTPEQKLRIVQALQRKGEVVAVTGDGVNDAPALRQADIGIAMGRCGTEVARAAADVVLLDDNFATIVTAVEEGRAVFANIRKFIAYILTSNVPELVPYLAMVLLRVPLALTIIQILCIDLGTDMVPALGLGAEEPEPGLMARPPRSRNGHLWDASLLARAYLFLGAMEAAAGMALFFMVLTAGGWVGGTVLLPADLLYRQATTACLLAVVLMQAVNVFLCRSERESVWSPALRFNPWIAGGVALELGLVAVVAYTPWANVLFATAPVPAWVWPAALPFAAAMLVLEELRKSIVRSGDRSPRTCPPLDMKAAASQ